MNPPSKLSPPAAALHAAGHHVPTIVGLLFAWWTATLGKSLIFAVGFGYLLGAGLVLLFGGLNLKLQGIDAKAKPVVEVDLADPVKSIRQAPPGVRQELMGIPFTVAVGFLTMSAAWLLGKNDFHPLLAVSMWPVQRLFATVQRAFVFGAKP